MPQLKPSVLAQFGAYIPGPAYLAAAGAGIAPLNPAFAVGVGLVSLGSAVVALSHSFRMKNEHSELEIARAELHRQAHLDNLTGLLNRSAFHKEFQAAADNKVGTVAVFYFDLDKFKDINDSLGHRAGDEVLVEVARRCEKILGNALAFARLGGDEFAAVLLPEVDRSPEFIGREIIEAMNEPMQIDGKLVNVGTSVGIAIGAPEIDGVDDLLRRADFAMYEAKNSQRGACRVFDDVLNNRQTLESSIRVELGKSMLTDELSLVYQPLVDARSGKLSSVESLLRWRSHDLGEIAPSTLIPIAEESGRIEELTQWTLDRAFQAIKTLENVAVAVNISPVYFKHPEFVHRLFDQLIAEEVAPELLILEITEGVLISDIERAKQSITRLRDIGVQIFLDDFGTGYSSLSYLQHFALDGLKLDKPFLRSVGEKRQATQIIRTMINFGHSLDMKVVVEGVENEWHVRLLQLLGCDLLQGYEIGTPMSLDDIILFREAQAIPAFGSDLVKESEITERLMRLQAVA
jgi:diguanylate cyclase (GGDEF)-like protein